MKLTFIPDLFFVITAFLLLRNGVRKIRWTIVDETLRGHRVIERGMAPTIMQYFRSICLLNLSIVIGSYEMSNRIAWWALAGLGLLLSLGGLVVSRSSTYQELKTELVSEEDDLEKAVRIKKRAGVVFLVVLAGWLASGSQYFQI